jgi:TPP-dependent pyruvate/acetoin dehydrogenase alpha subunit
MLRIRLVEEKIAERYSEQQMRCPVHLSIGQEAVAVGACAALADEDQVFSTHRSHGHYLARGGDLPAMIAELYGKQTGCSAGRGGSMHLIAREVGFLGAVPIVGSTLPIAVGAALGTQMRNEDRVSMVFFGEGATEEGVFHESLNFAVLKELPVVFVCENNQYSVYSPLTVRQPAGRKVYELAAGYGLESTHCDGNDALEVRTLVAAGVDHARSGDGPAFIEFSTHRWREHCGPDFDDDLGYRTLGELLHWQQNCPINRLEACLQAAGSLTDLALTQIRTEIQEEIEAAFAFALSSPFPETESISDHVYAS